MGAGNQALDSETWLARLRERFIEIARQRVEAAAVEDLVQEALTVVFQKVGRESAERPFEQPPLAWSFQVLRNVIGNHYQRERTRRRRLVAFPPSGQEEAGAMPSRQATPLESLERKELRDLLRASVAELSTRDEFCGEHLGLLLGGSRGRAMPDGMSVSTFHVRLFRCRQKLRRILMERGYLP